MIAAAFRLAFLAVTVVFVLAVVQALGIALAPDLAYRTDPILP